MTGSRSRRDPSGRDASERDPSGRNRSWRDRSRRERRRAAGPRVVRDTEVVFRTAILAGVLSAEPSARNWAGHYLYMFHDEDGAAWFKHRDTRAYVSMSARRAAAGAAGGGA